MSDLFFLLLPLAAFTGWWIAKYSQTNSNEQQRDEDYFKGLGLLLEDKTEEALAIFVKIAHFDKAALGNQVTLGNIFRHQGEIDRALHIHNTLLDKGNLGEEHQAPLQLALADDYYAAGILDHAEKHYQSVVLLRNADLRQVARRQLVKLYASQSRWQEAIEIIQNLDPFARDTALQHDAAHYYCELAEQALVNNQPTLAKPHLEQALKTDGRCFRANMMLGKLAQDAKAYVAAIAYWQKVEQQDPQLLLEVLTAIKACYLAVGQQAEWGAYLARLEQQHPQVQIARYYADYLLEYETRANAQQFLATRLAKQADLTLLQAYIALVDFPHSGLDEAPQSSTEQDALTLTLAVFQKILGVPLKYRCDQCGFRGNQLLWQCPGCKSWGTFAPIAETQIKH